MCISNAIVCVFDLIVALQGSVWNVRPREAHFHIMKKDQEAEYWPRLTSDKAAEKKQPISVDWSRYTDEDEEDESSGFDTNAMGGGMVCTPH